MSNQPKLFRDPIHGFIVVPTILQPLIDTYEFQRLRRLTQLGVTPLTFHGAEHSRFGHSLGTMHLFNRIVKRLDEKGVSLSEEERLVGMITALLHDIGHGPFSHVLERFLTPGRKHEYWTVQVVTGDTAIHKLLTKIDATLPEKIQKVIEKIPECKKLISLLSSQLDVDRMDYLLRDSYYTGTGYGIFDLERLIEKMAIDNERVYVTDGGLHAIEQFVFARYYAYWQIYFHKTTRCFEKMLQKIWERASELYRDGKNDIDPTGVLAPFLNKEEVTLRQYLDLDNNDFMVALKNWTSNDDAILSDLSRRFLYREQFKTIVLTKDFSFDFELQEQVEAILKSNGYDPKYYILKDSPSDVAYDYYTWEEDEQKPEILIEDGKASKILEISKVSDPIKAIASQRRIEIRLYVPDRKCLEQIKQILEEK